MLDSANNIVQYGWKKEAIPIVNEKKINNQIIWANFSVIIVIFRNISCFK